MYGIIEAPDHGWLSTQTLVDLRAPPCVVLAAFVAWELRANEPMLDLRFFRNPRFTAATTAITLVFFAMFGSYFLFTQYLQFVHGYGPLERGRADGAVGARLHGVGDAVGEAGRALRPTHGRELRAGDRRCRPRDRRGDEQPARRLLAVRARHRRAGARHGHHHRAVDGCDHALAAAAQGGRRLGGQRHHA